MDVKLKLSMFSGNAKDWKRWSKTFLAKSKLRGYKDTILGSEESKKDEPNYQELKTLNDLAHAELLVSCESDLCFAIIENSKSERFPDGDAALAWLNLTEKFEPKTKMNIIKLKKEFMECKLTSFNKDPDKWLINLENLKWKLKGMGHEVSDKDMMVHIFHNLPKEYENTIEIMEIELENGELDLNKMRERLRNKFTRFDAQEKKEDSDTALIVKNGFKPIYKKQCYHCGEMGHKGYECPKREQGKSSENTEGEKERKWIYKCHLCGDPSHKKYDCPFHYWNRKKERAYVSTESGIVLMGGTEDLENKNLWICDTGASCHMTGSSEGLSNIKNIDQKVILGDGRDLEAERIGDLRLKISNNDSYVVLKDVKVVPDLKVNLFSVSCALNSGASMKLKGEGIIISKGKMEIDFDQILKMGKGHLMAAKMEVDNDYGLVGGGYTFENIMEYHKKLGHPSI
jgi:gag-polypeptide of LTR copia-type/Zinc knuckle